MIDILIQVFPIVLGIYLFGAFYFGCPFCFKPMLSWPIALPIGILARITYRYDLWPESWKTFCEVCDEEIAPDDGRIHVGSVEGNPIVCGDKCLEEIKDGE